MGEFEAPFPFSGVLHTVLFDLEDDQITDGKGGVEGVIAAAIACCGGCNIDRFTKGIVKFDFVNYLSGDLYDRKPTKEGS